MQIAYALLGPTASGKSALAMKKELTTEIAAQLDAAIAVFQGQYKG